MKQVRVRITRKQYEELGGMANRNVWRKGRSDGYWAYYAWVDLERGVR
jgi:hypothetical protein